MPKSNWISILESTVDPRLAGHVSDAIADIAEALTSPFSDQRDLHRTVSLADGLVGPALFFYYLDEAWPRQGYDKKALTLLESTITATENVVTRPGLYDGLSGVAWLLEHLTGRLIEPPTPGGPDPGAEVAAVLSSYLKRTPWNQDYDLIRGLVGVGVWAIERLPRSGSIESIKSVVQRLDELAVRSDDFITWRTPPERMLPVDAEIYPKGNFNVGVAHGVPGVIGFLGKVQAMNPVASGARELLDGAVKWLLAQRLAPDADSCFPYVVAPGLQPTPARLAWCYGDLGVAAALLCAARAANEPTWESEALAIAQAAAMRPHEQSRVFDGGLCHGAAGLAHLYNRLFQATNEPLFRAEALAWLERLLAMRQPGKGHAGWNAWRPGEKAGRNNPDLGWRPDIGLLTGISGIGLALLSAVTSIEPAWDRVLLSCIPPRPLDS